MVASPRKHADFREQSFPALLTFVLARRVLYCHTCTRRRTPLSDKAYSRATCRADGQRGSGLASRNAANAG